MWQVWRISALVLLMACEPTDSAAPSGFDDDGATGVILSTDVVVQDVDAMAGTEVSPDVTEDAASAEVMPPDSGPATDAATLDVPFDADPLLANFTTQAELDAAFSPTPTVAGALAPVSPPAVAGPVFAPLSAAATCLTADPNAPPPEGDVDLGEPCFKAGPNTPECAVLSANPCQSYCHADGHCHTHDGGACWAAMTAPQSFCKSGSCVVAQPPAPIGAYFSGLPLADALGKPGRCEHGFVMPNNNQYEKWIIDPHPRNPVDDNPCTLDGCTSCVGMAHAPQPGACRVGTICGQCVAGQCAATPQPAVYDMGFSGAHIAHPRGMPDGVVIAEVTAYTDKTKQYGLARWDATGNVTAQVWSSFPLRQAYETLDSGELAATVQSGSSQSQYVALAFDPTSLTPLLPPLASDEGVWYGGNIPVLLPDGSVSATPHGLQISWLVPGSAAENWAGLQLEAMTAHDTVHGVVVLTEPAHTDGNWTIASMEPGTLYQTEAYEGSWLTVLTGGSTGAKSVLGPKSAYFFDIPSTPGAVKGSTALDGIGPTPAGTIAGWGRVRSGHPWPEAAAVWLADDGSAVLKTVVFDELPTVEAVIGWQNPGVGGAILPDGGVAVQVGRAVAWTDGSGKKIGYALLPAELAGMRLFATWSDGTIGLVAPNGSRLAKIPWSWAATSCP